MDRYKAVNEWLTKYPQLYGWLDFNAIKSELSAVAFKSVPSGTVREDICGNKTIDLLLALEMVQLYDDAQNNTNYDAMNEVLYFKDWIEEQNTNKNFPTFDENEEVEKIDVTQPIPTIAIDQDSGLAHYQFQFRIRYKHYNNDVI